MVKNRIRTIAASALATGALSLTAVVGAMGGAHASEEQPPDPQPTGCPSGAVCIYPNNSWNGGHPSHVFYEYGAHKFYNQFGPHRVFNNQYGGAGAQICFDAGGSSCYTGISPGTFKDVNLTELNSVKLTR